MIDIESEKLLESAKITKYIVISELINNSINFILIFYFNKTIIDVNSNSNAFIIRLENLFISIRLSESKDDNFSFNII